MPNKTFEVTVLDQWPKLKILVKSGTSVKEAGPFMYDIALSQFTTEVSNSLRQAVEEVIHNRKRGQ